MDQISGSIIICKSHNILIIKKNPTAGDYNELLKASKIIDILVYRKIQHLVDIRNLCCHAKDREPTKDEINDLINDVNKIIKTLY